MGGSKFGTLLNCWNNSPSSYSPTPHDCLDSDLKTCLRSYRGGGTPSFLTPSRIFPLIFLPLQASTESPDKIIPLIQQRPLLIERPDPRDCGVSHAVSDEGGRDPTWLCLETHGKSEECCAVVVEAAGVEPASEIT